MDIYDELIGFASNENLRDNASVADKKRATLLKQENVTESPATPTRDPKTGKGKFLFLQNSFLFFFFQMI